MIRQSIKALRKKEKISQADLARMAGISKTTLNNIEQGKTDPKYSTIEKIINALNVKIVIIERDS